MVEFIEGGLNAEGYRFGLVVSRFNDIITNALQQGAIDALVRHGADEKKIKVAKTPGAFEITLAAQKMCDSGEFDAVICLGAVIRGGTPHFEYVAGETSRGIGALARSASIPVVFGVLTTDNLEQALERSGGKSGNKGWEAAMAAIEMVNLLKNI
ncbi:MAG: 6,7-dimethyl-8-ribityllumazine synthase [Candidatus Nitrohelix vancouverensis]|uniref:6,7-dimethyl-8-ribityllumazine synthase n=1 Tax=Candidatus Nitrohelix vancouverensis TaxID=2705534 RepID=A0A7T0C307_9BACT|nr:MAG: 6,7-dimethyl-8-ribityllumazine synthase [Candidatus Nitrohelix vancouverensis]